VNSIETDHDQMTVPRLVMRGLHKAFGATRALVGVDLELAPGEVLALIGENGAGKSTLMKVLSGVHRPDRGEMRLEGEPYRPQDPLDARRHGVVMIYQELALARDLSVEENIMLGVEPRRGPLVDRAERRRQASAALARLGCEAIDVTRPVRSCSVAQQQMIEIARAMVTTPRVLVLDEPTSSLTRDDVRHLFAVIARLREQGVSVIYISHFLEECQAVADRYVVLRDGASVASGDMAGTAQQDLIHHMVGRAVEELYPRGRRERGEVALRVRGLSGRVLPHAVDLELHRGEVLGIFGLIGSGRTELLRCLFGLDAPRSGSVQVLGRELAGTHPGQAWRHGMGLVSEDRKGEGLLLIRDLADNLTLTRLRPYRRGGMLAAASQHAATADWIQRLAVRCRTPRQAIGELSGGNQQKIAIGRLLHHGCELLLLDEPTRGIDVAAKARIYQLIDAEAAAGKAVLVVSSYVPELLGICDRIAVMCRGRLGAARPVAELDERAVMRAAIGQEEVDHG
jgi:ribose transport system ATP-binding protein